MPRAGRGRVRAGERRRTSAGRRTDFRRPPRPSFSRGDFENRVAPPGKENVAVAVRPFQAALVGVDRREAVLDGVHVDRLLNAPPVVRDRFARLVIAHAQVIEAGRIQRVAIGVVERTVAIAVPGKIGMAMNIAAHDAPRIAAGSWAR